MKTFLHKSHFLAIVFLIANLIFELDYGYVSKVTFNGSRFLTG